MTSSPPFDRAWKLVVSVVMDDQPSGRHPHHVRVDGPIDVGVAFDIMAWMRENVSKDDVNLKTNEGLAFAFSNHADLIHFRLRWG